MAAALTALTRHTIRAAAWNGATPGDVLRQLNHAMQQSGRETFCTALYCTLRPTSDGHSLSVTAGGHPLPVIIRATGEPETIGAYGTVLGVTADAHFTTVITELRPGDTVVLYTDGITDVSPPHDLDPSELQTLIGRATKNAATADQVAANLGTEVDKILPFSQRDDDIALLILKGT
jgi:serine phosphatase RsbU (regulator of sigma subunit)